MRCHASAVRALTLLTALQARPVTAQEQPLPPLAEGRIAAGATQSFTVDFSAGDITVGTFQLTNTSASLVVVDERDRMLKKFSVGDNGRMWVGFLAPISGRYRVQIISRGSKSGSYSLRLRTRGPAAAANVPVVPIDRYGSARIKKLSAELQGGQPGALSRFWEDAAAAKGVFIEPVGGDDQNVLATFLWREVYETHNVKLIRPPESATSMDFYLSRLPGSDVWHKTMKVHRTTRLEYGFAPNHIPDQDILGADPYVPYAVADPLNPNLFPADIDLAEWTPSSVLVLPDAPDDRWALQTPSRRGSVVERTFDSRLLNARLNMSIYTPPGYAAERGPYALIVLFDGPAFNSDVVAAPKIVDNLIAADKIRPPVVCFVSSVSSTADRAANLQLNPTFADAIATELVPWLGRSFAISANAADRIVGGFSAGANSGLYIGLRHPNVFGNVLAQDGVGGVGRRLPQMFIEAPKKPLRVYMVQFLYNLPDLPTDELAAMKDVLGSAPRLRDILLAKGYEVTYREVGATHEWWYVRTTLPDALLALLPKH